MQIQLRDVDVVRAPRPVGLDALELVERAKLERIQAGQHLDQLSGCERAGVRQESARLGCGGP